MITTQLVAFAYYTVRPSRIARKGRPSRALAASYQHKVSKHGAECVPLILDYAGNFHPDSLKFLTAAAGKDNKSELSF